MGWRRLALLLVLTVTSVSYAEAELTQLLNQADAEYAARNGTGLMAKKSLDYCEQALKLDGQSFEALWRAARACFWVCDRTEDQVIKKEFGDKGKEYGKQALTLEPNRVEGHYFFAITLGEYGKAISIPRAVMMGLDGNFKDHCLRAIELDKSYEHGGPLRALGVLYYNLPWPKYSAKKAEKYLMEALEVAPAKIRTSFYLAELYAEEKEYERAIAQLESLLQIDPLPDDVYENGYYKEKARSWLIQLHEKVKK